MAVRNLTAPVGARRSSRFPFTDKEVEQSIEMLDNGETPGVGPYKDQKEARSAVQALKRLVIDSSENFDNADLASKAWTDAKGDSFAILRVK